MAYNVLDIFFIFIPVFFFSSHSSKRKEDWKCKNWSFCSLLFFLLLLLSSREYGHGTQARTHLSHHQMLKMMKKNDE